MFVCLSPQVPAVPSVYSAELRQLVTDMMQKDPQRRPTVGQLVTLPIIQVSPNCFYMDVGRLCLAVLIAFM